MKNYNCLKFQGFRGNSAVKKKRLKKVPRILSLTGGSPDNNNITVFTNQLYLVTKLRIESTYASEQGQ